MLERQIDGQLSESEQSIVSEHFKSCPDCRLFYSRLLKLQQVSQDFLPDGDENFWLSQKDKIIDRINRLEEEKVVPVRRERKSGYLFKLSAVAASIALIAFISIYEYKETHQGKEIFPATGAPAKVDKETPPLQSPQPEVSPAKEPERKASSPLKPTEQIEIEELPQQPQEINLHEQKIEEPVQNKEIDHDLSRVDRGNQEKGLDLPIIQRAQSETATRPAAIDTAAKNATMKQTTRLLSEEKSQPKALRTDLSQSNAVEAVPAPPVLAKEKSKPKTREIEMGKSIIAAPQTRSQASSNNFAGTNAPSKKSNDDLEQYAEWSSRLEYLKTCYEGAMKGQYQGSAVKKLTADQSKRLFTADFAEAFYSVAVLTPNPVERSAMINNLQSLLNSSDAVTAILIKNYLGFLTAAN